MTPAERALLVAIGEVVAGNLYGNKVKNCIEDVQKEDRQRAKEDRMRPETVKEYTERVSR